MIPPEFVQELLARVDIVDVVGRSVQLKKAGANFLGLCPFHGEKSPSFTVSPAKQFYHCFGCGAHGSAISFLMEFAGLSFPDTVRELASSAGLTVPEIERDAMSREHARRDVDLAALMEQLAAFYKQRLKESPRAIEYLKQRGMSGKAAARYGIGFAPDQWRGLEAAVADYQHESLLVTGMVIESEGQAESGPRKRFDRFRDRIMFPIRNPRGQVIGFGGRVLDRGEPKYMNSPETPLFSKGRELYGLFEARAALRETNCAIVVEGYMDVVMLAQHGVGNAVATLGTATTPDHLQKLLRQVDRVVFAFDGDAAGRKAAWRALEAALPKASDTKRIDFLFLPAEHDPDTYVREHGREAFEALLTTTETLLDFLTGELCRRCDVSRAEGRAELLALARPLYLQMPPVALRMQLAHQLADLARISSAELQQYLAAGHAPRAAGYPADIGRSSGTPAKDRPASRSTAREPLAGRRAQARPMGLATRLQVLTALHPALARDEVEPGFLDDEVTLWLERLAGLPAGSSFAGLNEMLRAENPQQAQALAQEVAASAALADYTFEEAREEFRAILIRLREAGRDQEISRLVAGGLTEPEERERLQYLRSLRFYA